MQVQSYMSHIQANAEHAVRTMLTRFSEEQGLAEVGTVEAEDCMDDGTPIKLAVRLEIEAGATQEFSHESFENRFGSLSVLSEKAGGPQAL